MKSTKHVNIMQSALRAIAFARDHKATYGKYPANTVAADQGFDDWAADVATFALSLSEGRDYPSAQAEQEVMLCALKAAELSVGSDDSAATDAAIAELTACLLWHGLLNAYEAKRVAYSFDGLRDMLDGNYYHWMYATVDGEHVLAVQCKPDEPPQPSLSAEALAEIEQRGYYRGRNMASSVTRPEIGDRVVMPDDRYETTLDDAEEVDSYMIAVAYETEWSNRDFSPFELTASEFNNGPDPEGAWEAFGRGIDKGIAEEIAARRAAYDAKQR